jgi:hypothetical protein
MVWAVEEAKAVCSILIRPSTVYRGPLSLMVALTTIGACILLLHFSRWRVAGGRAHNIVTLQTGSIGFIHNFIVYPEN